MPELGHGFCHVFVIFQPVAVAFAGLNSGVTTAGLSRPAGPHLTVVRTTIGSAQSVALAIDRSRWPEVVGTISGDDTIFIATASERAQRALLDRLRSLASR